jgi:hypothetical protein
MTMLRKFGGEKLCYIKCLHNLCQSYLMRLSLLSESVFDVFGQDPARNFYIAAEQQDDTNCLVAYRLTMGGQRRRISCVWAVSLNGQRLGMLTRHSQNWVGVNWQTTFATRYEANLEPGFKQIMTAENRAYLESMMKKLGNEISRAMTERRAEVVRLPIDPTKL